MRVLNSVRRGILTGVSTAALLLTCRCSHPPSPPPSETRPDLPTLTRGGSFPLTLSQLGVFSNVARLEPKTQFIPYDLNAPFWSDGAQKQRWIALPPGSKIAFAPDGEWKFPPGTVLLKHFELPADEHPVALTRR